MSGSNYRTWKPSASATSEGGLFISTKIDHIRGLAKDDHNQLEMTYGSTGKITSIRSVMQIQGKVTLDTGLISAAASAAGPQYGEIAELGAEIFNSLYNGIQAMNEHGGRENFPAVVQHNINWIGDSVHNINWTGESVSEPLAPSRLIMLGRPSNWATTWAVDRLDILGRGTDGAVYHKCWNGAERWQPSELDWTPLGGQIDGSPAVVSWGPDRLDILVRGSDNAVYHKCWNGAEGWQPSQTDWTPLGGQIDGSPAVVSWGPDRLDILVRGSDNAVYHKCWNGAERWFPADDVWKCLGVPSHVDR